ncbi:hypothetical protein MNR02_06430 [Shinella sp. H4-D48]|uniref:hypothetical protein n=1 Tax=Shinella sp. H4-D48 TaxID=2925841 RepID=UPI001F52C4FD|nr:hypothetical protein [Shinella sp. H4-D48]UNK39337.1 hypothetical protein MNR02_06430 [Shinella sp. H4-D48]
MATNNRIVDTEQALEQFYKFIANRKLPFTASITDGKHRTNDQNSLQRKWVLEISAQLVDQTSEEVRGYCKLHFGVPILRNENDVFKAEYDAVIMPLPYEHKLKLMMVPFDFGVTRIMTTRQKTDYLNAIHRHFSEQGLILTNPEDRKYGRAA